MAAISAVIITYNEETNIKRCLESVATVADEILIIDSFSTDQTTTICREFGCRVIQRPWEGYSRTKNFGNQSAQYDFILSIDADEVLSPRLITSLLAHKPSLQGAYSMNRLTNYCGKWIHHCGWYPDPKVRLFNRQEAHWVGEYVHEYLQFNRPVATVHLAGDLWHYSFNSFQDHLQRVNQYSELAAQELVALGKENLLPKMLFSPMLKFFKIYLVQRGFLDGFYGFSIASISAFDIFIRYAKAIQLRKRVNNS